MNNSRIARKYERLLFKGVPESPEGMFERDDHSYVHMRTTGKSPAASVSTTNTGEAVVLGYFKYNYKNGTKTYVAAPKTKRKR